MSYKELNDFELIPENAEIKIYKNWIPVQEYEHGKLIGKPVAEYNIPARVKQQLPKSNRSNADAIRFRKPPHLREKK